VLGRVLSLPRTWSTISRAAPADPRFCELPFEPAVLSSTDRASVYEARAVRHHLSEGLDQWKNYEHGWLSQGRARRCTERYAISERSTLSMIMSTICNLLGSTRNNRICRLPQTRSQRVQLVQSNSLPGSYNRDRAADLRGVCHRHAATRAIATASGRVVVGTGGLRPRGIALCLREKSGSFVVRISVRSDEIYKSRGTR